MKKEIKNKENYINHINITGINTMVNILYYIWRFLKIFIVLAIIVGFIIFFIAMYLFKDQYSPDLLTELERKYNEKFMIVSQIEKDDHIYLYKISPQNNKEITFNAYQRINAIQDDYRATAIKYYLEKYEKENDIESLEKKENMYSLMNNEDIKFLDFDFWIKINKYEDIEQATNTIYNIKKYISQNVSTDEVFTLNGKIKKDEYTSPVSYTDKDELDDLIYEEKYYYINYLKENNLSLSGINSKDIENIWKPKELKIIVDGKTLTNTDNRPLSDNSYATYNPKIKEYEFSLINILENTNKIEKVTNENGNLKEIIYNGQRYTISANKEDKNSISNESSTKDIKEKLNANIKYDYVNYKLYIFF